MSMITLKQLTTTFCAGNRGEVSHQESKGKFMLDGSVPTPEHALFS